MLKELKNKNKKELIKILFKLNKELFYLKMFLFKNNKKFFNLIKKFKKYISIIKLNLRLNYGKKI